MKTTLLFAALCAIFALSQAASIKTKSLNKCQETKIIKMINEIVSDTYALKTDVLDAYSDAVNGVLDCIATSFTTLETCVTSVVTDEVSSLETEAEDYVSTVETLAAKIETALENCI